MQIYFSPEVIKPDFQVLNVVDQSNKAVGYIAYIMEEKKLYVSGHLEEEGVNEDFKDLIKPYINGLSKLKPDLELFTYLSVGGKTIDIEEKSEK